MLMGLLSREVSISSTLACEEVSSGGAEASTFGDGGISVPGNSLLSHGGVFWLTVVIIHHASVE